MFIKSHICIILTCFNRALCIVNLALPKPKLIPKSSFNRALCIVNVLVPINTKSLKVVLIEHYVL